MVDTANTTSDRTRAQDGKPDDEKPRTRRGWGPRDEALFDEARRARDEPISTSRRCKPSPQVRHAIRLLNREINNGLCCLPEDDQGKAFLTVMRALGLPPDQMLERDAPWFRHLPEQDQQRLNAAYRAFDPTSPNILKLIFEVTGLTALELRKYAHQRVPCGRRRWKWEKWRWRKWTFSMHQLLQIIPSEADKRQREREKNERRKEKRQKEKAERARRYDPREMALIETMLLIKRQPGCHHPDYDYTVANIIRSIEKSGYRAAFPHNHASLLTIVHRTFDRLERKGVVETKTTGKRVRIVTFTLSSGLVRTYPGLTATPHAKPLIYQRLALTKPAPDLRVEGDDNALPEDEVAEVISEHPINTEHAEIRARPRSEPDDATTITGAESMRKQKTTEVHDQHGADDTMREENARMRQRIIDLERVISNVMLRLSPRQEAEADRGANTTQH